MPQSMAAAAILVLEPLIPRRCRLRDCEGNAIWHKLTKTKQAACPLGAVKQSTGSSRCKFNPQVVHNTHGSLQLP